jgi:hypothetical protein
MVPGGEGRRCYYGFDSILLRNTNIVISWCLHRGSPAVIRVCWIEVSSERVRIVLSEKVGRGSNRLSRGLYSYKTGPSSVLMI